MKSRTSRLRTLCLMLAALACGLPAVSQEVAAPAYNIEIVVFRAASAQGGAENWAAETGSGNTIAGDEGSSTSSQVGHFVAAIPSSAYQLTEIEGGCDRVARTCRSRTQRGRRRRADGVRARGFPCSGSGWMCRG